VSPNVSRLGFICDSSIYFILCGDKYEHKMIYTKIHERGSEVLIAACDEELLGKKFSSDDFEIEVSERFYGGEVRKIEELTTIISQATMANLVGNRVVSKAIQEGLVSEAHILEIGGVKHAQYVVMFDKK